MAKQIPSIPEFAFLKGGGEMGEFIAAYDWSKTILGGISGWSQNLRAAVSLMLKSRFPMLIFWGPELITFYNDAFRPSLGGDGKHPGSLGQRGEQSWAESWPVIGPMIYNIMAGGDAVWFEDQKLPLYRDGKMGYAYWTYSFSPIDNGEGTVAGLLVTCAETTKAVEGMELLSEANKRLEKSLAENRALQTAQHKAHIKLQESQRQLLSLFEQSPVALATIARQNLTFTSANPFYGELVGRKPDEIIGKPLLQALPELTGQGFDELLNSVLDTGVAFVTEEMSLDIMRKGKIKTIHVKFAYQPMRDEADKISAVLVVAVDVTPQVAARKRIEESEARFAAAIDLAELATWKIDLLTNKVIYSQRLQNWLGVNADMLDADTSRVHNDDRERITKALRDIAAPGGPGTFDEVYKIINSKNGRTRIIHSNGRAFFDDNGTATSISGTAQDVTIQRELQLTLQQEVQSRTEELAATVEELRATNEELAEANEQLTHSNEELAQYAYVASHDLQEPLRKIQVFSGMLANKTEIEDGNRELVNKIGLSAGRMGMLIRDLLEFSRLLKSDTLFRPTDLNGVVSDVLGDFELIAGEKNAQLNTENLPVIEAVGLQMNQLFYNLISNALKFTRPGVAPVVSVSSELITNAAARRYIRNPLLFARYHRLCVKDNGIGFETKYNDQIFEVFKRLHGRDSYPGSGIGLALCRRIVANHNGYLYTESTPGQGSAFYLILPDRQSDNTSELPAGFALNQ